MTIVKHTSIYAALHAAQATMPNAILNKENPHFHSKYADLTSIREATLPHLNPQGIAVTQPLTIIPDFGLKVATELHLADNPMEMIASEWLVPFGTPQAMGSGITYGRRYTWASVCAITAEEDDDANAAENAAVPKKKAYQLRLEKVYPPEEAAIRACQTVEELKTYRRDARPRIADWNDGWKKNLNDEWDRRKIEIEEGVTEEGRPIMQQLRASVGKLIDDEIPEPGSSG